MNQKDRVQIAELRTHILYIRENLKEINKTIEKVNGKLDKLPCNPHGKRISLLEEKLKNIKEMSNWSTKKTIAVISAISSIISSIITAIALTFS
ncbi:MAG: hypothetical protein ACTSSP_07495 [Candidatus Asgardarchaeia archaeon]